MEKNKYFKKLLEISKSFDIEKYREPDFHETHVPITGTPKKHPNDKSRILITENPFSVAQVVYEFPITSIKHIEDLETISSEDGKSAPCFRFWIKKGTVGIKHEPYIV